ncbi:PGF-pre-PGF domain-containing protein, partial [Candidatus Woesearchaeota archaeon]|nr:PGF-pre-PGF domain-containing protein [Candidatus Woesearchaeota archaeon]
VGYNFTVDGIRPSAQLTVTNGGITVSDQGTVTRGVIPVITCRDASGDTLPSSSLNITVDRPGSADNSPQATAGVGKRGSGDTIVLNFDTAGSGESNGEFTVTCTTSDIGSSSSATSRFTVLASAGSGDSSGGSSSGGGAGSSEAPQTTTKTVEFAAIDAGKLKVVQNFGSGAGLKSISFKIKAAVTAASMEVSTSATKPSTVSSTPNSKVARYFEVKTTNIDNNNIQEATINFEVDKAWMESNSIKDNEIALYRYADNKWEKFVATKSPAQGSTSKITYRANVPGFSVWAIAFSEAAAPSTGETGETGGTGEGGTGTEPTTEEETKPNKAGTIILWIVIIVIVVGAIAYYLMRKKKPSKK